MLNKISMLLAVAALAVLTLGGICTKPPLPEEEPEVQPTTTEPEVIEPTVTEEPVEPEIVAKLEEHQLQTVYYDFDKFNLRSDARAALDHNYDLLREFPGAIVKIEGHCDERGTVEYNLSLGEKRAKAAMDYLIGLGIPANRISITSYGKERPVDPGHNEDAWAKNRRAEFRVLSQ